MGLSLLQGLCLFVLGALGASSLVQRFGLGKKGVAALEPYAGWMGVIAVVWGVYHLVLLLIFIRYGGWIVGFAVSALFICLGLVLGVGILKSFLKDPEGRANLEKLVQRLAPYRQSLGVVAMVLGGFAVLSAL